MSLTAYDAWRSCVWALAIALAAPLFGGCGTTTAKRIDWELQVSQRPDGDLSQEERASLTQFRTQLSGGRHTDDSLLLSELKSASGEMQLRMALLVGMDRSAPYREALVLEVCRSAWITPRCALLNDVASKRFSEDQKVSIFFNIIEHSKDEFVSLLALAVANEHFRDPRILPITSQTMSTSDSYRVRAAAAELYGKVLRSSKLNADLYTAPLHAALLDRSATVRETARQQLGQLRAFPGP